MSANYYYKDYPQTCAPNDFWGQVKRTVNGKPVSQEQIDMIVAAVSHGLDLGADDTLLDLCCGNGALSTLLFQHCKAGVGVDFSEYLIKIAMDNFSSPEHTYVHVHDVTEYAMREPDPGRFTKAMCYGSLQYLEAEAARTLLKTLNARFSNIERVFIGNVPDKDKVDKFHGFSEYKPGVENDPGSPIGIWRSKQEFEQLAHETGWKIVTRNMPKKFYASAYRYDTILIR